MDINELNHKIVMGEKEFDCCYCHKKLYTMNGIKKWKTFNGKYGHHWCVKQYDKEKKPEELKIKEHIEKIETKINELQERKQRYLLKLNTLQTK